MNTACRAAFCLLAVISFMITVQAQPLPRNGWPVYLDSLSGIYTRNSISWIEWDGDILLAASSLRHATLMRLDGTHLPGWPFDIG